jgi:hypothetical protein
MDLSAEQRLAEVHAARRMVWRRRAAEAVVVVEETAVRRLRIGWARSLAAPWDVAMGEWAEWHWWNSERSQARAPEAWSRMERRGWRQWSRAPDQIVEMPGAQGMKSARPLPGRRVAEGRRAVLE